MNNNIEANNELTFGTLSVKASDDIASQASDSEIAGYCCSSSSTCQSTGQGPSDC
ncbi:MAG: hypothetical protein ACI93R_003189 [Flavobacteriales bacterium]|jgi:hypothetical protein